MIMYHHHHYHYQSVLPKGRSFTANLGTKAAILAQRQVIHRKLRNQRLQFYW